MDEKQKIEFKRSEVKRKIKERIDQVISMEIEKARKPKPLLRTTFEPESIMFSDHLADNTLEQDNLSESSRNMSPSSLSGKLSMVLVTKISDAIQEQLNQQTELLVPDIDQGEKELKQ